MIDLAQRRAPQTGVPEPYLSRVEIAKHMAVSPRTIDRWCREGLPHETWGMRSKKFQASRVEGWARRRAA